MQMHAMLRIATDRFRIMFVSRVDAGEEYSTAASEANIAVFKITSVFRTPLRVDVSA